MKLDQNKKDVEQKGKIMKSMSKVEILVIRQCQSQKRNRFK